MPKSELSRPVNLPDFAGLDLAFDIVDSHHHLFDLEAVYYPWLSDRPEPNFLLGDYTPLKQAYSVDDYRRDSRGLRVVKTVHVEAEADHQDPLRESAFLDRVIARHGWPDATVGHAWLHLPQTEETLARQAAFDHLRGIRSKPVTSAVADRRDSVRGRAGSLQDPAWRRGLGLLPKYGLSWDLRVPFWHLREAAEVCGLYQDLAIVVEHCGLPWDRGEAGLAEWRAGLSALAAHDNVMLKISELGLAAAPWDYRANRRIVREAIGIFGFARCMFASNFPVAGLRIGYTDQVKAIAHMVEDCSADERRALFHDTACRFYRL